MGYTHYWKSQRGIDPQRKAVFLKAVRALLDQASCPNLAYESDETDKPPRIDEEAIRFNGIEENGHETFYLDLNKPIDFAFTKTALKPYDMAVTAVLTLAHHFDPEWLEISSDGDAEEWQEGVWLARQVIPEARNPLDSDGEDPGNGPAQACPMCTSSAIDRQPKLDRTLTDLSDFTDSGEARLLGYTCGDCGEKFWVSEAAGESA